MRNADKYTTAESRADAYNKYCYRKECSECQLNKFNKKYRVDCCMVFWLELEAEEEDTLRPCPFCGGKVKSVRMLGGDSIKCKCGYCATFSESKSEAIAAHNRVAKAVMDAKNEVK